MKTNWSVTYERYYPHEDICEPDELGFVCQDVSLREAVNECRWPSEADESPIRWPRWFTQYKWNDGTREYYEQGIVENRSLHIPDQITPSSRLRLARLLGVLR